MRIFHIPKMNNVGIRKIIHLEYTREESLGFINGVAIASCSPFVADTIARNFVNTFNSIILDNLLRFVNTKDSLGLVSGMTNSTLGLMLEVGHRHYTELMSEEFGVFQTSHASETLIRELMSSYVNYIYLNNKEEMDAAILEMYELLYTNFGHMEIPHHRFAYTDRDRPMVIITGDNNEASKTL